MAKTKADYINAGIADAQAGKPRAMTGNESWQKQCYASGYNSVDQGIRTFERVSPEQHGRNMAEAGRGPSAKDYEGAVSHGASAVMADEFDARAESAGVLPTQEEADYYAKSEYMPPATMEHVRQLRLRANKSPTNLALHTRLHNKANALELKHLTRFLARG